jgi:hypothetical protein
VSFAAITLCVASQLVYIVVSIYFVIDSVRKLVRSSAVYRISLTTVSIPILGPTKSLVQLVHGVLFPRVKRSELEADHLCPSYAKVKKASSIYVN